MRRAALTEAEQSIMGGACTRAVRHIQCPGRIEIREYSLDQTDVTEADLLGLTFMQNQSAPSSEAMADSDEGPKDDSSSDKDEDPPSLPTRPRSIFRQIIWVRRNQESASAPRVRVN